MATFLTNGQVFLGPYSSEEPFAIMRGVRTLREVHDAVDIWSVQADTDIQARETFRSGRREAHR